MERKGIIAAVAALVLVGGGLLFWLGQGGADPGDEPPGRIGSARASARGSARGGGTSRSSSSRSEASARLRVVDDGGVRVRRPPARPLTPVPPTFENGARVVRPIVREDRMRDAEGAERTAGWRLGLTRGRISVVETRVANLRDALRRFEANGDTEAAERQRAVLQRFENRLAELREQERSLEVEASRDGTMGDVASGMEAAAADMQNRRAMVRQGAQGSPSDGTSIVRASGGSESPRGRPNTLE